VTACIGALTLVGPSIILAADTRVTHGVPPVGPNDQAGKQYPLPPYNFATAIAGSVSECHDFVGRLVQRMEVLSNADRNPYREEVMEAINDARFQVFRPKLDQALRSNLGITLQEWHDRFVPPAEFDIMAERFGMQVVRATPLNVSCIVGGFTEENTFFFRARGMEHLQSESSPGVHAIGSGSLHAMNQLNKRGQNLAYGLARTVFMFTKRCLRPSKRRRSGLQPTI
jgi:20S proteasome alpha/beta subunit